MKTLSRNIHRTAVISFLGMFVWLGSLAFAMPPNPERYNEETKKGSPLPYYLENRMKLMEQGIDSPRKVASPIAQSAKGTFNALAILLKFADKNSSVEASAFDTLIFIDRQSTVRNYYKEISYGQLDIVTVNLPSTIGWTSAPQTYAYYCNGQNGMGAYPQNSQKLCEDIVDLVNPLVDFSNYDNDLDGFVDALILVHTGPGAEVTWSDNDIWSHKWGIVPRSKDGVYINEYCIQPEYWYTPGDITCGVFCHELGHILGLPDLYDTDTPRDSYGIGKWSLMAYGSWNGPTGRGDYPAHPDAWSRIRFGFASATNVVANINNAFIPGVEGGGDIYRLWSGGSLADEYFLIENRQKTGYDSYLPSSGLLIWHIDETRPGNDKQWYPGYEANGHYRVALEQSDGLFEMEKNSSSGNAGDPFPGSGAHTSFSSTTLPSTNSYAGANSIVAVSDISPSAALMTASLQVSLASAVDDERTDLLPERTVLRQNHPNPFNPSTRIRFDLARGTEVTMTIFNILGNPIRELLKGRYPAGSTEITWDGTDEAGRPVPSGIYFYELVTEVGRETRKMTLIK
ncbi:MAG: M6 family metalloprotease domain-containing protein [candidate division Zixibacteria bacterium]|nr:M6 family metalloprotease domain-containing protein [candidate division Zixibacteria bacterium]